MVAKSQRNPDGLTTVEEVEEVEEVAVEEAAVEVVEAWPKASVTSATSGVTGPATARHQAMELAHLATVSVQRKLQL